MWYLIGFCLCVFVAILTAALLVERAKRRHAEDRLRTSHADHMQRHCAKRNASLVVLRMSPATVILHHGLCNEPWGTSR